MSRTSERRKQRLEELRKQEHNEGPATLLQKPTTWLYAGIGLLLLVVIAGVAGVALAGDRAAPLPTSTTAPSATNAAPAAGLGVEIKVPDQGGQHIKVGDPHAAYYSIPPTSGPHYETAAPWTSPSNTPLPEELWLHNLEHSGVVALYNCPGGCADLVNKLEAFRRTGPRSKFGYIKLLVLPYDKSDAKLTLVAWGYYLKLADYDEKAMQEFVTAHQDKGPEPNTP